MGALAQCMTDSKPSSSAIGAYGQAGLISDIDDAALQAIKNGIGQSSKSALKQVINLSFACQDLPNLDTFSKTDAFVILYELKQSGSRTMKQMRGRTEVIYDNLNPIYVKSFEVDYLFEEQQTFLVEVWDMDDESKPDNQ